MTVLPPVLAPRLTTPNALVFLRRFVKVACPARSPAAPRSQPELHAPLVDTDSSQPHRWLGERHCARGASQPGKRRWL